MLCAFVGVILMSITKSESSIQTSHTIQFLSIIAIAFPAFLLAVTNIFLRVFNKHHNFNIFVFYYSLGLGVLSYSFPLFKPDLVNTDQYDFYSI